MEEPIPGSQRAAAPPESTLLVVDDDEHIRRALRRALRRSRCRILETADGGSGLAVLAQEPVHVVISDYRMPGMSGVEFLREVKERWPRIQRVLLTGQADSVALEDAVNHSEIFRFISKPWDDAQLLLTIQSAVDHYWLAEENARLESLLTQRNAELVRLNRDLDSELTARSAALVRAAEEWRACFDAIGDPLAIVRGCEVQRANGAFARAAGVALNQLPGLRCRDHGFGTVPCPTPFVDGAAARDVSFRERAWRLQLFPFREGASVVVYEDVTEEREVQRRLLQAEKMAAVGQLAGGVAHEINNPLGGILAFAQLMSRDQRPASDLENLKLIADAALRAKRIVESLLRFSRRPRDDERGTVDLAAVVADALFLLQAQLRGSRVDVRSELAPARTVGNANQLQQIVVNLVVNAIQAMAGEGTLTVFTGSGSPGHVQLRVTDTGPGVRLELAERIFEPFFTTKPEGQGTGLGLSICYRIAEEHGGTIRVEAAPERGAAFVVELPGVAPVNAPVSAPAPEEAGLGHGLVHGLGVSGSNGEGQR